MSQENSRCIVRYEEGQQDIQVLGLMWMERFTEILTRDQLDKLIINSSHQVRNIQVFKLDEVSGLIHPTVKITM